MNNSSDSDIKTKTKKKAKKKIIHSDSSNSKEKVKEISNKEKKQLQEIDILKQGLQNIIQNNDKEGKENELNNKEPFQDKNVKQNVIDNLDKNEINKEIQDYINKTIEEKKSQKKQEEKSDSDEEIPKIRKKPKNVQLSSSSDEANKMKNKEFGVNKKEMFQNRDFPRSNYNKEKSDFTKFNNNNQNQNFNNNILNANSFYKDRNNNNNDKLQQFTRPTFPSMTDNKFNNNNEYNMGNRNNFNNFNSRGNYNNRGGHGRGTRVGNYPRNPDDNFQMNNYNNNQYQGYRKIFIEDMKAYNEYNKQILKIKEYYDYLNENDIINIIKITKLNGKLTIFEFINNLHKENIINKHKNFLNNINKERNYRKDINIYEQEKETLDKEHEYFISEFKTVKNSEQNKNDIEFYNSNEERRRKILRDVDGFYNYIPLKCEDNHILEMENKNDSCIFAHNDNEINYHPLVFKTAFCIGNCNQDNNCSKAHDVSNFRKIFEVNQKKNFFKFLLKMKKFLNKNDLLKNYLEYISPPTKFSLDTFKVLPCMLRFCNKDPHLCYFYHDEYERRRHPILFNNQNSCCKNRYIENKESMTKECELGDFCPEFHNKYEYVYYKINYQKIYKCQRPTNQNSGLCIYFETCYAYHNKDRNDTNDINVYKKKYENLKEKLKEFGKKYQNTLDENSELKIENEKLKNYLSCQSCKKIPPDFKFIMLTNCSHIICEVCMKKTMKNNQKICLICQKTIQKNTLLRVNLGPPEENKEEGSEEENDEEMNKNKIKKKEKKNKSDSD